MLRACRSTAFSTFPLDRTPGWRNRKHAGKACGSRDISARVASRDEVRIFDPQLARVQSKHSPNWICVYG